MNVLEKGWTFKKYRVAHIKQPGQIDNIENGWKGGQAFESDAEQRIENDHSDRSPHRVLDSRVVFVGLS